MADKRKKGIHVLFAQVKIGKERKGSAYIRQCYQGGIKYIWNIKGTTGK